MRYLVLADVHANLEALEACLADARRRGYDRVLVLGDLVGYGADPNAVIDRIVGLDPVAIVRGNHDKVASGLERPEDFNLVAKNAVKWTLETLTPSNREWLASLPRGPVIVDALVEICHGTPYDEDAYVFDELDALRALEAAQRPLCLFGHSHLPAIYELSADGLTTIDSTTGSEHVLTLRERTIYLLNPGSVGQPRDRDPRAAYAIVDTDLRRVEMIRIAYPVAETQAKVKNAGLPDVLAERLAAGR